MKLAELMSRLVNQGEFKFEQYEDIVLVEKDDEEYYHVKEVYWLPNNRVVIRLGERYDAKRVNRSSN